MKGMKLMVVALAAGLAGCSATTSFRDSSPDLSLLVNDSTFLDVSQPHTYPTTSFGQYRFRAEQPGHEPMYGILPLKFNSGYLTADILFFAPAMFFNLRQVYSFYEFDIEQGVVCYKRKKDEPWVTYTPTLTEVERAKNYFK